jgi:hypothetical protein
MPIAPVIALPVAAGAGRQMTRFRLRDPVS